MAALLHAMAMQFKPLGSIGSSISAHCFHGPHCRGRKRTESGTGFSLPQPGSDVSVYISLNKFNIRSNEYNLASTSDRERRILGVIVMDNLILCMVKMTVIPLGSIYASQR